MSNENKPKKGLSFKPGKVVGGVKDMSRPRKVTFALILVVAVVLVLNYATSTAMRNTVNVVKLKSAVPQDGRITADNMVEDTMSQADYEKQAVVTMGDGSKKRSIVLWDDRERIVNAYASYYIRANTPIYFDSLTKENAKKYSYLYKMDGELARIDLDAQEFGKMLVPGDKINVRANYTEEDYTLPDQQEFAMQQQTGVQSQTSKQEKVMMFNNAVVLDMLNTNGESIFDLYYQLLALPKAQQQTMLASEDFQKSVQPKKILLNVTAEEADRYMEIQSKSPTYMMTLLPRTSGNLITEALNQLEIGFARTGATSSSN